MKYYYVAFIEVAGGVEREGYFEEADMRKIVNGPYRIMALTGDLDIEYIKGKGSVISKL